jgi:hypothetical protein
MEVVAPVAVISRRFLLTETLRIMAKAAEYLVPGPRFLDLDLADTK